MSKMVTLAVFTNSFDVKYMLLKGMLEEAGIGYVSVNENARSVKPMPFTTPSNLSIEIKVDEENMEEAVKILQSIE
jgi:hypothetical protein